MEKEMRFSEKELSVIKSTFAEDTAKLKTLRKFMLQMPLGENETVEDLKGEEIYRAISKTFLPELDGDAPLGQNLDLFVTVNVGDKSPEDAMIMISARELVVKYLKERLDSLVNGEMSTFTLDDLLKSKKLEDFIARNTIVTHVEQQLLQLYALAGTRTETTKETMERLQKNSAK